MKIRNLGVAILFGSALLLPINNALGQAWIGQMVSDFDNVPIANCLNGSSTPFGPEQIAEAQTPSEADLQRFWKQVVTQRTGAAAETPKSLGAVFYMGEKKTKKADPAFFAHALAPSADLLLDEKPLSFARSNGVGTDAEGIWRLRRVNAPQEAAGFYRVKFMRILMRWKVDTIWAIDAGTTPEVKPYCAKPGDIEAAVAKRAERERRQAEKAARQAK